MVQLRYGLDRCVAVRLGNGVAPTVRGLPRGKALSDLGQATARALDEPLDYPPLRRATTPGDRVVVALDQDLPQTPVVTAAVVQSLVRAGVQPDGISVLQTRGGARNGNGDPCALLDPDLRRCIGRVIHDPGERSHLAYLAAGARGEPILLNRALHEADLVLPVGCLRRESAAGYFGIHGVLFPTFSDQHTLQRFRSPGCLSRDGRRRARLVRRCEEVAWLLGINFTIQLVPGAGESVLHVLAGQSAAVEQKARRLFDQAWSGPPVQRASLVAVGIEGGASQQTWDNLGRALGLAAGLVEQGGAIVVCCELHSRPGPALRQLANRRSRRAAVQRIAQLRTPDTLPALQLIRALRRGRVFLLSRLHPETVEELDMVPVSDGAELERLARGHGSAIVLANAPNAIVPLDEPE